VVRGSFGTHVAVMAHLRQLWHPQETGGYDAQKAVNCGSEAGTAHNRQLWLPRQLAAGGSSSPCWRSTCGK
jgi:hypothetical protein